MPLLPARADLAQLRRRAKELLRDARAGEPAALERLRAVSRNRDLATAQLALAREHGFRSWPAMTAEVRRRAILDGGDAPGLERLLRADPTAATRRLAGWADHPLGASPLGYVAMLRHDTTTGEWRDAPAAAELARLILRAGASVEGDPVDPERPLMTAASYGDAGVVRVLLEAGADRDATARPEAGGVPGGTALRHAAVFAQQEVVDVLVAAGATDLLHAATTGDVTRLLSPSTPAPDLLAGLRGAAEHDRVDVIDALVRAGADVDGEDPEGATALHRAAFAGQVRAVARLLHHGADPARRDSRYGGTSRDWCRHGRAGRTVGADHDAVDALLSRASPG